MNGEKIDTIEKQQTSHLLTYLKRDNDILIFQDLQDKFNKSILKTVEILGDRVGELERARQRQIQLNEEMLKVEKPVNKWTSWFGK